MKRPRISERLDSILRPWYFGGRCEAFETGILPGPWFVFDINSAYAAAMKSPHLGGQPLTIPRLPLDSELPYSLILLYGSSDGALPFRESDGSLSFPKRRGRWLATGHELIAGLETKRLRIDRVIRSLWFPQRTRFGSFIDYYWKRRAEQKKAGDHLGQLISKRTMNAVYGKLGQDPRKRFRHAIGRADDPAPEGFEPVGTLGPWILYAKENPSPWGFLHVGTAASITGAIRAKLLRALSVAKHPIYCDTDSVICRDLPPKLRGDKLGEWKLEAELGTLAVAGKKLYAGRTTAGDWKMASKGVRLPPETIFDLARGCSATWEPDAPSFSVTGPARFVKRTVAGVKPFGKS